MGMTDFLAAEWKEGLGCTEPAAVAWAASLAAEQGGGQMEGYVAHDDGSIERVGHGIGVDDVDAGQFSAKRTYSVLVQLQRRERAPKGTQGSGEGTPSGADLQDRPRCLAREVREATNGWAVVEKILAEFVTATVKGTRHERTPFAQDGRLGGTSHQRHAE